MGASAPFWRYSAASYPDLERTMTVDALAGVENGVINTDSDTSSGVYPSSAYRKCLLYILFISFGFLQHVIVVRGCSLSSETEWNC